MKHIISLLWLTLGLTLMSCSPADIGSNNKPADTLLRLADSEIRGLDPQKYGDLSSMRVAMDQFEGLTRFNAMGETIPGLAESWRVSDGGLTWTFTLRDALHFSDGTSIKAELFPAVWDRLHSAQTASPHIPLFAVIDGISAPDDQVVKVKLKQPMPQLPALFAHPALAALPLHIIAAKGDDWTADRPLVTSGAYRLTGWRLNDQLQLAANPAWHDAPVAIANIRWKPVEDSLTAMRLFMGGGADIATDYPESRHEWLGEKLGNAVRSGPYLGSYYFTLSTRKPPFDDSRVRQALSMSVDREWLSRKLSILHTPPAWGVVPPALYGGDEIKPDWANKPLQKRRKMARDLLLDAGYSPNNPLTFDIRINSSTEHRRMAVALAAMWGELGIEARILNSEAALHFASMRRGDFTMARSGWIADIPAPENFLLVHMSGSGPGNYSGYSNPEFDKALATAMAEADPEKRTQKMQRAETILIADAPVIPLYYYLTRSLVAPRVLGWQDNASNIHPSATLSLQDSHE
ncbi:peptide ABC transporter substrate-binding protein [Sphingorhabdus sp. Alg239-R122]|uniref:peptide ABC transporter substrate-binding protein n=1 Tax=Sphingorhabdus sp. Alg239-R122 TaxID=2305989 RepID=UPI0013DCD5B0|nr:peptide ABC transporter substrate-binding protein [Sphingorhabdus sp. Alg239-R122]